MTTAAEKLPKQFIQAKISKRDLDEAERAIRGDLVEKWKEAVYMCLNLMSSCQHDVTTPKFAKIETCKWISTGDFLKIRGASGHLEKVLIVISTLRTSLKPRKPLFNRENPQKPSEKTTKNIPSTSIARSRVKFFFTEGISTRVKPRSQPQKPRRPSSTLDLGKKSPVLIR